MSDIKNISNGAINANQLHEDQLKPELNRSGSFQGANVNAVRPPEESPLAQANSEGNQRLNASRAVPPGESPVNSVSGNGYRLVDQANTGHIPNNEQLFDHATGTNQNSRVSDYLAHDPAASQAVAAIQRGHQEIGSIDREPQLDQHTLNRLNAIGDRLFRR